MSENPTVNLNTLCYSRAKMAGWSSELTFTYLYVGSSIRIASEQFVSCIQLSIWNSSLHPAPQKKKNLKELGLEILLNSSVSVAIQNFTYVHVNSLSHNDRCYCLSNYWPFLLDHPVFNYKYKQNTVKHNSISDFIKVYFLLCFVQRNVSALVMNHLQDDYFS